MSQKTARIPKPKRKEYIKRQITQKAQGKIAEDCGVSRETISRDIREMRESGEWQEWIELELLRLHVDGEIDDDVRYKEIAKLYARTITHKTEAKIETKGRETITVVFDKGMDDEPDSGEQDRLQTTHDSDPLP